MDDPVARRLAALEAEVARLTALIAGSGAVEPTAPSEHDLRAGGAAVSRRRLLMRGGLAAAAGAAGAAGIARPAAGQSAETAASNVSFVPTGGVSSTTVQAALAELDADKQPAATLDVRVTGAVGNGTTDDTDAIQAACNLVSWLGGGTVTIPSGTFRFSAAIVVPDGVDLWGAGGHQQGGSGSGSVLKAAHRDAEVVFQGVGGTSGNLGIDGDRVANPDASGRSGLVYIEDAVVRHFAALRVSRSVTDGVVIRGAQNCLFSQCMFSDCTRHGLVLEAHAQSSAFVRCDISNCGGDNLHVRRTGSDPRPPNYNTFIRCAFERGLWQDGGWTGPNNSLVNVNADGDFNTFLHCGFTLPAETRSTSGALVILSRGRTLFDSCDWYTVRPGIRSVRVTAPGTATFIGRNLMETPVGIEWNADGQGNEPSQENVLGQIAFGSTTIPWTGTARPHETASFYMSRPHEVVLRSDDYLDPADGTRKGASYGLRVRRHGEAGLRFQVSRDGEIQCSDGTSWTPKARWRVGSSGGWTTPDPVQLGAGLHISAGSLNLQETGNPDPASIPAGNRAAVYVRSDKLVVAFKEGSTVNYKWLPLTGTSAVWSTSTTPP